MITAKISTLLLVDSGLKPEIRWYSAKDSRAIRTPAAIIMMRSNFRFLASLVVKADFIPFSLATPRGKQVQKAFKR